MPRKGRSVNLTGNSFDHANAGSLECAADASRISHSKSAIASRINSLFAAWSSTMRIVLDIEPFHVAPSWAWFSLTEMQPSCRARRLAWFPDKAIRHKTILLAACDSLERALVNCHVTCRWRLGACRRGQVSVHSQWGNQADR